MRVSSSLLGIFAMVTAIIPAGAQAQYHGGARYGQEYRGYGHNQHHRVNRHDWRARERWERRHAAEERRYRHHHHASHDQYGWHR